MARTGLEPATSRTLHENHTYRQMNWVSSEPKFSILNDYLGGDFYLIVSALVWN